MLCTKSRDLHSSLEKTGRVLGIGMVTPADPTVLGSSRGGGLAQGWALSGVTAGLGIDGGCRGSSSPGGCTCEASVVTGL